MILLSDKSALRSLSERTLEHLPRLRRLKAEYMDIINGTNGKGVEVCIERARLITESMKASEKSDEPMVIRRAKAISHYLSNRAVQFLDDNLLAGSTTSKAMGAPVYPELLGMSIWPELDTISTRDANPQKLSEEDAQTLNLDVFPYWIEKTALERTRTRLAEKEPEKLVALELMERVSFFMNGGGATVSHMVPNYQDVLKKGLLKMIEEAHQREVACAEEDSAAAKARAEFYQATKIAMHGILAYAKRLSAEADRLGLETIKEVLEKVPAHPAESFHQAINSLWLCHVAILAENVNMAVSPGRLDQILYPYFEADVSAGKLDIDRALELIGCLWLKISDNTNLVPESAEKMFGGAGSVPAVTLGGIDDQGHDAVNDLTYLMLSVTDLLCIRDPNVNARYCDGVNETGYLDWISKTILHTRAIPAIYNDTVVVESLVNQGVELADARDYAIVGCVEPTTSGCSYAETSAILLNLTAVMDLTLNEGRRPPFKLGNRDRINPDFVSLESIDTFEQFLEAFDMQLGFLVDQAVDLANALGQAHCEWLPTPLLSCFYVGPLQSGRDLSAGGAKYNSSGATHVGFADVCDSLNAVEAFASSYTGDESPFELMRDAVAADFVGYDEVLDFVLHRAPKFGSSGSKADCAIATRNAQWLVNRLYERYQMKRNCRGGAYRPAFWTMTNHAGLGQIGRALPSGRRAKEPFSSGITPVSQTAKDLLVAYESIGALCWQRRDLGDPLYPIPGGIALNMKYTPVYHSLDDVDYTHQFGSIVRGYFAEGGMQVQYTIQDYGTLLEAKQHPEKFPDLIVRVSGYSAFFKDLNEAMQDELIARSQYNLLASRAVLLNQYKGEAS